MGAVRKLVLVQPLTVVSHVFDVGKRQLLFLYFQLGFLSLAIEILTIRALAPFIGTSIVSSSLCIGTVVIGLSLGYFLATRFEQLNGESLLRKVLLRLAGSLLAAPVFLLILKNLASNSGVLDRSFILTMLSAAILGPIFLGGIPSVCLGFCSPILFELVTKKYGSLRVSSSRCFMAGGAGSLLGALLPGFLLIPLLGVTQSFVLFFAFAMVTRTWIFEKRRVGVRLALILLMSVAASYCVFRLSPARPNSVNVSETRYQTTYVDHVRLRGIDTNILTYDLGFGIQSIYDPNLRFVNMPYYAGMLIPIARALDPQAPLGDFKVLVLGSAGGTMSSAAAKVFGSRIRNLEITDVDIDPAVHEIAKRYFGAENPYTRFETGDARIFIQSTTEKYDYIMVDLFSKGLYVPSEALSVEFFGGLKKILRPRGVIQFNLAAASEHSELLRVVLGGVQTVLPQTYITDAHAGTTGIFKNYYISASDEPIDFVKLEKLAPPIANLHEGLQSYVHSTHVAQASTIVGWDDSVSSEYLSFKMALEALHGS